MSAMDFKGVTWVENIYQKFEAMCLEVEETMYQDTVKFVENQVQTVGANVKKFYSDVMQDLVPPSFIDPVKVADADLGLKTYACTGVHKKQKASINDDTKKVDKILTEDFKVTVGLNGEHMSSLDGMHNVKHISKSYSRGSIEGSHTGEVKDEENCGKAISKKDNCHSSKERNSVNHFLENQRRASSVCEISQNCVTNYQMIVASPQTSVEIIGCDSREEEKDGKSHKDINSADLWIDDRSFDFPTSDTILLPKSNGKKGRKLTHAGEGVAAESLDSYCNTENSHSADEEVNSMSYSESSGDCYTDMIENNSSAEPRMETIKQDEKSKLEETCVLVDGNDISVHRRMSKHRSYKKKMPFAFSLKKSSSRWQEYEQLGAQCGYIETGLTTKSMGSVTYPLAKDSSIVQSQTDEFCESEWELL